MSELNLTHSNGNKVKLTTPDTLAANKTFKLPGTDGSSGQFLKTDGSGALSFATVDTSIADGSITAAKLAAGVGGKIVQVKYKRGGVTTSSNSGGWTDSVESGLNVDITPVLSSSFILVQMHSVGGNTSSGRSFFLRLRRKINNTGDTNVASFQIGDGNN